MTRTARFCRIRSLAAAAVLLMAAALAPGARAADAGSISTDVYGSPTVTTTSDGTTIDVESPPAGLYYNIALDPTRSYRIVVVGQALAGSFMLRLMRDADTPTYEPAHDGVAVYRVSNADSYQLLYYAGAAPGSFRVSSVTVEDCGGTCGSDADLKSEILQETPDLQAALSAGDEYRAARLIEDWAAPRIPSASVADTLPPADGATAAQLYYDYFLPGRDGVYCYGAADFLHKLLEMFSIPSFVLAFGDPSFFTHSVVGIPVPESDGSTTYRLLDPTFDGYYTTGAADTPISIPQMLELWRAGLTNVIQPHFGSLESRHVVFDPYQDGQFRLDSCSQDDASATMCNFGTFTSGWAPVFTANGYESGLPGLLHMLGTLPLLSPDALGVPQAFQDMQATFAAAVARGDDSVHVAILPLAPASAGSLPPLPSPVVGGQLATDNGQWSSPAAPISGFTYGWESCDADGSGCVAIPDTNAPTFTPTPAELGRRLLVRVSASNLYGESAPQTALSPAVVSPSSAPTQPSTPQYTPAQRPRVSNPRKQPVAATPHIVGVPEPGKTLACRESVTNGRSDPWSYVWLRNGRRLRSARRPVHVVVARDVGTRLRCGVYQRGTAPVALRLSPPVAVVSPRLHRRGNVARPRRTRSAQRRRAAT